MTLPPWLKQADIAILELVNRRWTNGLMDTLLPWVRNQITWYPLYLFMAVLVMVNFGKKGFYWILGFVSTIAIADLVSSRLFKYGFERIRPCRDPEVMNNIILRIPNCSGGYSFTSSHAANHFAMATFIFISLHHIIGNKLALIFVWAGTIAYAQVYVGVHYPVDIAGGALVGILAGNITGRLFKKEVNLTLKSPVIPI